MTFSVQDQQVARPMLEVHQGLVNFKRSTLPISEYWKFHTAALGRVDMSLKDMMMGEHRQSLNYYNGLRRNYDDKLVDRSSVMESLNCLPYKSDRSICYLTYITCTSKSIPYIHTLFFQY